MSFREFFDAIESRALRDVAQHWDEARGNCLMPGWKDLKPARIKLHLPIIWSWKFDASSDHFVGRIAGEKIQSAFGLNIRGAEMSAVFRGRDFEHMFVRHKRIVTEPAFFVGKGLVFRHLERFDIGERIIMPLADDGSAADGIVGATEFRSQNELSARDFIQKGESENWFTLA